MIKVKESIHISNLKLGHIELIQVNRRFFIEAIVLQNSIL